MIYESYLTHHGIKGQRWGVRRFQKKDGSLTPAGRKRQTQSGNQTRNRLNKNTAKTVAKIGLAVAGTALAAYGAYKLHSFVKTSSVKAGGDAVRKVLSSVSQTTTIPVPKRVMPTAYKTASRTMAKPGTLKTVTSTTKKASTYVPKLTLNSSTPTKDYTSSMLKNLDRIKSQTSSYSSRAASVGSDLDDFTKQLLNRTRM